MRIIRKLANIATCPEIVAVYGQLSERAIAHRLEKGQIPGAFQSGATWFLEVETFLAAIRGAAKTGILDTARSPADRLASQDREDAA